jgi:hypothetical protein
MYWNGRRRSVRNALALDPGKAEHYEVFALAAVVQRAIKPAHLKGGQIQDCFAARRGAGRERVRGAAASDPIFAISQRMVIFLSGPAWNADTFHQI